MHTRLRIALAVALGGLALSSLAVADSMAGEPAARSDSASATRYKPASTPSTTATLMPANGTAPVPKRARERTIAPFPVPGDTSAHSVELWRTLNLPRSGLLTVAPLPAPGAKAPPGATSKSSLSERDSILRQRLGKHIDDCPEGGITMPEAIHREQPVLPSGTKPPPPGTIVKVFALVSEDGSVETVETPGRASVFDIAAAACVRRWKFTPARHCGHTLPVFVAVPIRFDGR